MSSVTKKPPASSRDPAAGTATTSPSRSARSTPASSATGTAVNGHTRSRSIRAGTPVSARAAAQQRRDSPLSNGSATPADTERDEAARAETIALLDDLKERLAKAESTSESYKKTADVLQVRLDEALGEQARLEEKCHEYEEQVEGLQNERREAARQMREMEAIYEAERSAMAKEKDDMANREEEMQMIIQRLKDSLAQRNANGDDELRPSRHSQNNSPSIDQGSFAPPSSLNRSDSRNNSKLLLQKDKLIESLRLELAEAQIKLVESENQGGGRLHEVERLLMEARMANARLMEDNESYQLLLQERTLKGDFATSDFSYMGGASPRRGGGAGGSSSANQDALNALEGRTGSAGNDATPGGTSLADELSGAADSDTETAPDVRRLEAELRTAKDQNKALTLYINRIIERLLQHKEFEHILDQSSDPPKPDVNNDLPPPPQPAAAGPSLLQRAKSIAAGAAGKPKPRPMSFMPSSSSSHTTTQAAGPSVTNPDTAPSIPIAPIGLTRSASTRRGRPMSEQFTAAHHHGPNLVNALYRGPADSSGQFSPTLNRAQTFFSGQRVPSSSTIPQASSGNFPGESSSSPVSGDGDNASVSEGRGGGTGSPPSMSSPPRSERDKREGGGGATFAGNKPRPLRLVQENAAAQQQEKESNKRASWIGWAWGGGSAGGKKGEDGFGESIKE
ncbi:M protein, serotype 2.1 [Coniochaeta hoffmannii]|uniref:M protein, serotype 2.1 n=1 Tax=Coniochaeta hoffmannii TaxID=91930 RepID=A0AA38R177_9PEZI|nr:M protein, serotype 2.1 [Coniochaeta hoffmannii]